MPLCNQNRSGGVITGKKVALCYNMPLCNPNRSGGVITGEKKSHVSAVNARDTA